MLPDRVLFYGFAAVAGATVLAFQRLHLHPLLIASYGSLAVLGLTWTLASNRRNLGWRMVLSFLILVLAGSLTPDVSLAVLILFYVVSASLLLLTLFMESELERTQAPELDQPVSGAFLLQALQTSVLVFLLSLSLFPILPRPVRGESWGWQPGYTENVDLASPGFSRTSNRAVALRISRVGGDVADTHWVEALDPPLLRGRVLEIFDGTRWIGAPLEAAPLTSRLAGGLTLQLRRNPLSTEMLPAPYGASVELGSEDRPDRLTRTARDEWVLRVGYGREVTYRAQVGEAIAQPAPLTDRERQKLLLLPRFKVATQEQRWRKIAERLRDTGSAARQAAELQRFFKAEGFRGVYQEASPDAPVQPALDRLSRFLLEEHEGHCELFATTGALLLRMAGTPTRLLTGFRLGARPVAGILTVREEDAHAWIEYWDADRGWTPLDVTPRVRRTWSEGAWIRDLRDQVESYWFRYVVGNGASDALPELNASLTASDDPLAPSLLSRLRKSFELSTSWLIWGGGALLTAAAFSFFMFFFKLHLRRGAQKMATGLPDKSSRKDLARIRRRLEKRGLPLPALYEELRFGPEPPDSVAWRSKLKQLDQLTR